MFLGERRTSVSARHERSCAGSCELKVDTVCTFLPRRPVVGRTTAYPPWYRVTSFGSAFDHSHHFCYANRGVNVAYDATNTQRA